MNNFETIKEMEWTETEQTRYGEYRFNVIKRFRSNGVDIIEETFKNGIIWYSAMYPANSDYAKKRMAN